MKVGRLLTGYMYKGKDETYRVVIEKGYGVFKGSKGLSTEWLVYVNIPENKKHIKNVNLVECGKQYQVTLDEFRDWTDRRLQKVYGRRIKTY